MLFVTKQAPTDKALQDNTTCSYNRASKYRIGSMGIFLSAVLLGFFEVSHVSANPSMTTRPRSAEFRVPAKLRARVNFWKDIFTRYGKNQVVIHHRDYPGIVFKVMDFKEHAARLNEVSLERYKEREVKKAVNEVKQIFRVLATGGKPAASSQQQLAQHLEASMQSLPGGNLKYKKMVTEDLVRAQTGIRERYAEALIRSGRYLPIIERIFVKEFGLPVELTRLPFIESSFNYQAYSSVGAAGIWQFMPRTGRLYMTVNNLVDERRDPIEATKAAAKYLQSAYNATGSWPLAITAYNHGTAGVIRKVKKIGTTDISSIVEHPKERVFGFASNNFYAEFLAALEVYDNYHTHFPGLELEPALRFASLRLPHAIYLKRACEILGVEAESLKKYNYALSDRIWSGKAPIPQGYAMKVPLDTGSKLPQLLAVSAKEAPIMRASVTYSEDSYRVHKGDTLERIAKKFGTSIAALKELNDLSSDSLQIGQKLTVKKSTGTATTKVSQKSTATKPSAKSYVVKSGDSLWTISRRVGRTVSALKAANNLRSNKLKPGQVLVVP